MVAHQHYDFSGPFSPCRGECGRAVIAAVSELCDFCKGIAAHFEANPPAESAPEPAPEAPPVTHALHVAESEPETQPAFQ